MDANVPLGSSDPKNPGRLTCPPRKLNQPSSMPTASEFIDLDVNNIESEQRRVAALISSFLMEPFEIRFQIANELLRILLDREQKLTRRCQAAAVLGGSAKAFGIQGSVLFAKSLIDVIRTEFVTESMIPAEYSCRNRRDNGIQLDGFEIALLQTLVFALIAVDQIQAKAIAEVLYTRVHGGYLRLWLESILGRVRE